MTEIIKKTGNEIKPSGQKPSTMRIRRILDQRGPFTIQENFAPGSPLTTEKVTYIRDLLIQMSPEEKTVYRAVRRESLLTAQTNHLSHLSEIAANPQQREEVSNDWYRRIGRQYQIEGDLQIIKDQVKHFAETADAVIGYLQRGVLNGQASVTEMTNEVAHTANPFDLFLMMHDHVHYNKRARFEAKRKLFLMELAAKVEQTHQTVDPVEKLKEFDDFLNRRVWKEGNKIGETETVYRFSTHDPATFTCQTVEMIDEETAKEKRKTLDPATQMLKGVGRRYFTYKGEDIPVYITTRPKDTVTKILKMLRKDTDNPNAAVEDDLGFMGVFDTVAHANAFQEVLQNALALDGLSPHVRDLSDTLSGGEYLNGNAGSSKKTRMRKMLVDFSQLPIEVILHTNQTYLDYYNDTDVRHDGYITKRLYSTGVVDLVFPSHFNDETNGIYHIDLEEAQKIRLAQINSHLVD